jgi:hypothetical protein
MLAQAMVAGHAWISQFCPNIKQLTAVHPNKWAAAAAGVAKRLSCRRAVAKSRSKINALAIARSQTGASTHFEKKALQLTL